MSNSESESTQVIFEETEEKEEEEEEEKKTNHINYTKSMKILIKLKKI
jgi:hypothetical protein